MLDEGRARKGTRGKIKACPTRGVAHVFKNQTRKGRPPRKNTESKSKSSQDFKDAQPPVYETRPKFQSHAKIPLRQGLTVNHSRLQAKLA